MDNPAVKLVRLGIIVVVLIILAFSSTVVVPTGYSAVHLRFGTCVGEYQPGLNLKMPIVDTAVEMSTRDEKTTVATEVSSKDVQTIKIDSAIIVALDSKKVVSVYTKYGNNYMETIVNPMVLEALNNEVAKYPIEQFIDKKPEISNNIKSILNTKLTNSGIIVKDFVITSHDFSDEYDKAVEAKKIAEQKASKAKFDLDRVTLEAEAQKKKQASLTQTVLMEKWIDKWDGKLPTVITGNNSSMLMNIPQAPVAK